MPKAIRYKHNGQYLQNTLFWTQFDYIAAFHAQPGVFNATLAAEEEAMSIESHKQDFAVAFGIPADEIECEVVSWDGDESALPFASDASAPLTRLPQPAPPPPEPTPEERIQQLEAKVSALSAKVAIAPAAPVPGKAV